LFKDGYADYIDYRDGKIYIDLPAIVKLQLSQVGLVDANVRDSGECNYDLTGKFFSFRRDHPPKPQSMVAFVGLQNK
jgi:copper oxidase (laccase) domain-containing protein